MSRVQFKETVTIPGGVAGALIPVPGVAAIPFLVNPDGTDGPQANAYEGRTGATAAPTLVTDSSGSVSYWLDAGDYDIQVADQNMPPRIQPYTRGFTAPVIDTTAVIQEAQGSIQFSGDTKFSFQSADHGLKTDGTFMWLLVKSEADGGGRKVLQTDYQGLWNAAGQPAIDSQGYFRLPNISGRGIVAAGAATGLTARALFDMFGAETHTLSVAEMPPHDHNGVTGVDSPDHSHFTSGTTGTDSPDHGHAPAALEFAMADGSLRSLDVWNNPQPGHSLGMWANTSQPQPATGGATARHAHGFSAQSGGANTRHAHQLNSEGGGASHNIIQPSTGMNLFVKS